MKKLSEFSVNYPVTVLMLVLAILLLGYISFDRLGIDLLPELSAPRLFIEVTAGDRPPEEIETQLTKNLEAVASRLKKVAAVSSITKVGTAQITVEYTWNTDMDEAFLDLQKAVNTFAQNTLVDEIQISQQDPNARPILILGFWKESQTDLDELRRVAENYIQNELVRLEGIASVELIGTEEKEVLVQTDPYLMEAYGVSSTLIASKISSFNRNISAGSITEMGLKYIIKGVNTYQSLEDIQNIILTFKEEAAGQATESNKRIPVYLKEVAQVSFQNKDPENRVHINQKPCIGLAVYKETKYNTVKAVDQVLDNLDLLKNALPAYELNIITNQATFINTAISEVQQTALIGILLAVGVLFVFLRRIGVTLIISASIPISIIATFNLMYFNGLSLNIMTLGGLALGAGMLVDNAIVVMENIFRRLEAGDSLKTAAIEGTAQVAGPITASTVTTIVVFLPIVYLHGAAGELFRDQAWTVAFSLVSSLFVAILLIPMLSVRWLQSFSADFSHLKGGSSNLKRGIQFAGYSRLLVKIMQHKLLILVSVGLLAILSFLAIPFIGNEFLPRTDQGEFSIDVKLPEGSELKRTAATVSNLEQAISAQIGSSVDNIYSQIGPSSLSSDVTENIYVGENTANIKIILKKERAFTSDQLIQQLQKELNQIPEVELQFVPEQTALQLTLGMEKAPLMVEIKGKDLTVLQQLTREVAEKLQALPELTNLSTSFDEGRPEINLTIDRTLASTFNISLEEIETQLNDILSGRETTQWEFEGELKDITLRFPKISVQELHNLVLTTSSGNKIRVDQIADIRESQSPKQILRNNQNRIGQISAHLQSEKPFNQIIESVHTELAQIAWPAEYNYQITGEELKREQAFGNLKFALILALILVYMVLAAQFESLIQPFLIILIVPLACIGAVLLFFILQMPFNIMSYIGLIMLAGIAVNNAIILVDATNQLRESGLTCSDAILMASQMRLRPIMMTSLTTILALLPLTLGIGEGAALRAPMAVAVIGGLISSTVLTLIVIPMLYELADRTR
jgi:HAE1 family hydrophobic/amphiphilic exporter-1